MEEIGELIDRYGLAVDREHVIIPLSDKQGRTRRCFLLNRRFIRIIYPDKRYIDYPLSKVIEAIVRYPDIELSEALLNLYRELDMELPAALEVKEPESLKEEPEGEGKTDI
jgi:hypothetical protein